MKKAKTADDAWAIQETYEGQPHGWIQWKGTDVCMDFHCKCGAHLHFDGTFIYFVKCGHCSTSYALNGHIEAIELEVEPKDRISIGYDD